jgi:hypothetical protein
VTFYGGVLKEIPSFIYELKDFFKRKVVWHYKILNPVVWLGIFLFPFILLIENKTSIVFQLFSTVIMIILLISLINRAVNFKIRLSRKHDTGFFKKNLDKILLIIIGSLIGGLITLLFQKISK